MGQTPAGWTEVEGQHRVGVLTELPQVLRDLGAEPVKVLPAVGINAAVLRNPENPISFVELGRLLQACVAATGCEHFGLLVGQRATTDHLGLVGRLMRNAPTLGDAMLDLCTNQQRYIRGAVAYLVIQNQTAFLGYAIYHPNVQKTEQISDGALAVGFRLIQELAGVSPSEVLSSRASPGNIGPYSRLFGVPPRFNAEQHALVFPKPLLDRPIRRADPKLRKILEKSVAKYWAVRHPTMAERVVRALRPRVVFGGVSLEDVAAHLLVRPRTLNRKLQADGASFRSLLNEARFEVARQLLAGTRIEITDIALVLGYSEPSGFTHAFQRWSGTAPSEWRARV
jgi:AraC-like DNA-binding protein